MPVMPRVITTMRKQAAKWQRVVLQERVSSLELARDVVDLVDVVDEDSSELESKSLALSTS